MPVVFVYVVFCAIRIYEDWILINFWMMKYIYYHSLIIHHGRRLFWRGNSEERRQVERKIREGIPKENGGIQKENGKIDGGTNGGITKENERTKGSIKKVGRKGWELRRIKKQEKRTRRNGKN